MMDENEKQGVAETSNAIDGTATAEPNPRDDRDPHDRMAEWLAGYEHGLQNNSPRTQAELDRLKDILGWNPPTQPAAEAGQ